MSRTHVALRVHLHKHCPPQADDPTRKNLLRLPPRNPAGAHACGLFHPMLIPRSSG